MKFRAIQALADRLVSQVIPEVEAHAVGCRYEYACGRVWPGWCAVIAELKRERRQCCDENGVTYCTDWQSNGCCDG